MKKKDQLNGSRDWKDFYMIWRGARFHWSYIQRLSYSPSRRYLALILNSLPPASMHGPIPHILFSPLLHGAKNNTHGHDICIRVGKKENHLDTISKMMATLVRIQLYTFSYRKPLFRPQIWWFGDILFRCLKTSSSHQQYRFPMMINSGCLAVPVRHGSQMKRTPAPPPPPGKPPLPPTPRLWAPPSLPVT